MRRVGEGGVKKKKSLMERTKRREERVEPSNKVKTCKSQFGCFHCLRVCSLLFPVPLWGH